MKNKKKKIIEMKDIKDKDICFHLLIKYRRNEKSGDAHLEGDTSLEADNLGNLEIDELCYIAKNIEFHLNHINHIIFKEFTKGIKLGDKNAE